MVADRPAGACSQFGRIEDPASVNFSPSVPRGQFANDVVVGYSSFHHQFASANYAVRFNYDIPGTWSGVVLRRAWPRMWRGSDRLGSLGDFSSTVNDPNSDSSFWTLQESPQPANTWAGGGGGDFTPRLIHPERPPRCADVARDLVLQKSTNVSAPMHCGEPRAPTPTIAGRLFPVED